MIKRTLQQYWNTFKQYESFDSKETLFASVVSINKTYELSNSMKSVLNTIKLHSQTFFGVCWLKVSEIAKKSKVSIRTVHRVLDEFKKEGILSIFNQINTRKGGKAPNVYVINPINDTSTNTMNDTSDDTMNGILTNSDQTLDTQEVESDLKDTYNLDSNQKEPDNKNDKIIKYIPKQFLEIVNPYYTDGKIVKSLWTTTIIAVKKGSMSFDNISWETINNAWKISVRKYKKGLLSEDKIAPYYYSVLLDMCIDEYTRKLFNL